MIINDELGRTWKVAVEASFEVPSQDWPEGHEEEDLENSSQDENYPNTADHY
jgi:hypothetical protein